MFLFSILNWLVPNFNLHTLFFYFIDSLNLTHGIILFRLAGKKTAIYDRGWYFYEHEF